MSENKEKLSLPDFQQPISFVPFGNTTADTFANYDEFLAFCLKEVEAWTRLLNSTPSEFRSHFDIYSKYDQKIQKIKNDTERAKEFMENKNHDELKRIIDELTSTLSSKEFLCSESIGGKFILQPYKDRWGRYRSYGTDLIILGIWLGQKHGIVLRSSDLAIDIIRLTNGISLYSQLNNQALIDAHDINEFMINKKQSVEKEFQETKTIIENSRAKANKNSGLISKLQKSLSENIDNFLTEKEKQATSAINQTNKNASDVIEKHQKSLLDLEITLREQMRIKAPAEYWIEKKQNPHQVCPILACVRDIINLFWSCRVSVFVL